MFEAICDMNPDAIQHLFFHNTTVRLSNKLVRFETEFRSLDYHRWIQMLQLVREYESGNGNLVYLAKVAPRSTHN